MKPHGDVQSLPEIKHNKKIVVYDISGSYENDRILLGGVVYKINLPDLQ